MPSPKFSPAMLPPGDESDDWDDSPRQPKSISHFDFGIDIFEIKNNFFADEKTAGHTLLSSKYSPVPTKF